MAEKSAKSDAGQAQAEKTVQTEEEQGFRGVEVDQTPNKEFSLQSGPDSPTVADQRAAAREAESAAAERSSK